jgi:hypothetical protein
VIKLGLGEKVFSLELGNTPSTGKSFINLRSSKMERKSAAAFKTEVNSSGVVSP